MESLLDLSYSSLNDIHIDSANTVNTNLEFIDSALSIENFFNSLAAHNQEYATMTNTAVVKCSKSTSSSSITQHAISIDKPPEPYADMIAKAILSTPNNMLQLKGIYDYISNNYDYFKTQQNSVKWRNAVRHNLSSHKYFIKTSEKNAKGHFWSIHDSFAGAIRNTLFQGKPLKTLKIGSKFKRSASTSSSSTSSSRNSLKPNAKSTPAVTRKRKVTSNKSFPAANTAQLDSKSITEDSPNNNNNISIYGPVNNNLSCIENNSLVVDQDVRSPSSTSTVSTWSSGNQSDSAYLSGTDFDSSYAFATGCHGDGQYHYNYNQQMLHREMNDIYQQQQQQQNQQSLHHMFVYSSSSSPASFDLYTHEYTSGSLPNNDISYQFFNG